MHSTKNDLDFSRIQYLLSPEELSKMKVTIIGLGSGGAPVCDHLVMNGIRNFILFDFDEYEPVNLVKHPRRREFLGMKKVEIQKEWILDRNPESQVEIFEEDVSNSTHFEGAVSHSDLILCCVDSNAVREYVNDICVKYQKPCITASVFRTGIGGEIYGYYPKKTGCYQCCEMVAIKNNCNLTEEAIGLTDDEKDKIYGLGMQDYRASGLSMDIQMISLIQARMALDFLLSGKNHQLQKLKGNWIIFGNRPKEGVFDDFFESKEFLVLPQEDCSCN